MFATILLAFMMLAVPYATWAQGNPLGPEFRVNTYTTGNQGSPQIARSPLGDFVVVWTNDDPEDGSGPGVFGQRYASSGTPLGSEFQVNTYTTGIQRARTVASDPSGKFVVVWDSHGQDGSEYGVFGQRYASSGTPLGGEFRVNSYTTGSQGGSSVAFDAAGGFIVAWGFSAGVFGQRFGASGAPVGEFRVDTGTTQTKGVKIVADNNGNFVAVWSSYGADGSDYGVFARRYAASGSPLGAEFRVNTYTTYGQGVATAFADAAGNFVVIWSSAGQEGELSPFPGRVPPPQGIYGQRYSSTGNPLGPEFRVNTWTTGNQGSASVTADGSGNFVVVWTGGSSQDGGGSGMFGQRFTNAGVPVGPEFLVNSFTSYGQFGGRVASDSAGNFVVVWNGQFQEGPGGWVGGVFGQRFGQIVPVELIHFRVE